MSEKAAAELVGKRLAEGAALVESMLGAACVAEIAAMAEAAAAAIQHDKKLLLFGNGGSAAVAAHIAAEFVGRYRLDRQALPAIALTDNLSALTAIANDYGYAEVFARQVHALGAAGDLAIGLTTSGRSANVVKGLEAAGELGLTTVGMTGADPGPVGTAADLCVRIPDTETPRIQEGHMLAAHIVCEWVEAKLTDEGASA
jgi:D-sedoheptulose 7-phosphate isomerase